MKRSRDLMIARDRETLAALHQQMRNAFYILCAAIREIFDESAYDRFLLRTNARRSITSYRDFSRERDATMVKKPRCC